MGRSVSTPHNASVVAYRHLEPQPVEDIDEDGNETMREPDETDFQWEFDSLVEDLQEYAPTLWPSLRKCDTWLDREDHALLENDLCYMGISEYCGLVATWIVPKSEHRSGYSDEHVDNLCAHWISQIEPKFTKTFGALRKLGTMSNGEAAFQCIEPGVFA